MSWIRRQAERECDITYSQEPTKMFGRKYLWTWKSNALTKLNSGCFRCHFPHGPLEFVKEQLLISKSPAKWTHAKQKSPSKSSWSRRPDLIHRHILLSSQNFQKRGGFIANIWNLGDATWKSDLRLPLKSQIWLGATFQHVTPHWAEQLLPFAMGSTFPVCHHLPLRHLPSPGCESGSWASCHLYWALKEGSSKFKAFVALLPPPLCFSRSMHFTCQWEVTRLYSWSYISRCRVLSSGKKTRPYLGVFLALIGFWLKTLRLNQREKKLALLPPVVPAQACLWPRQRKSFPYRVEIIAVCDQRHAVIFLVFLTSE